MNESGELGPMMEKTLNRRMKIDCQSTSVCKRHTHKGREREREMDGWMDGWMLIVTREMTKRMNAGRKRMSMVKARGMK